MRKFYLLRYALVFIPMTLCAALGILCVICLWDQAVDDLIKLITRMGKWARR